MVRLTLSTLQETWAANPDRSVKVENEKLLAYLGELAVKTGMVLNPRWDLTAFCAEGTTNLHSDRNRLNKAFFDRLASTEPEQEEPITLPSGLADKLRNAAEEIRQAGIAIAQETIRHQTRTIAEYQRRLRDAWATLTQARRTEEGVRQHFGEDLAARLQAELLEVLREGAWNDLVVTEDSVWLATARPIINTERNTEVEIDLSVNLGRFSACWYFGSDSVYVFPNEGNVTARDSAFYHPHVDYDENYVCWGDAQTTAHELFSACKLAEGFRLLYALLSTYNPGNPYRELREFSAGAGRPYDAGMIGGCRTPHIQARRIARLEAERQRAEEAAARAAEREKQQEERDLLQRAQREKEGELAF